MLLEFVVVLAALAPPPSPSARMLVSLQPRASATVDVTIENLGAAPLVVSGQTYLTLRSRQPGTRQDASHWAEVKAAPVPTSLKPMRLNGRARIALSLDITALLWAPDRSPLAVTQPLGRGVPPGEYELQLQIVDESGNWWRSAGIPIKVGVGGAVKIGLGRAMQSEGERRDTRGYV